MIWENQGVTILQLFDIIETEFQADIFTQWLSFVVNRFFEKFKNFGIENLIYVSECFLIFFIFFS